MSQNTQLVIKEPSSAEEWNQYFHLRWRLLRAPWQQPQGSEKDDLEQDAIHRIVCIEDKVIAVGRLHRLSSSTGQIRYMAVDEACQGQGVGQRLLHSLEQAAGMTGIEIIELNARENAIGFYQRNEYLIIAEAEILFGSIRHKKMRKKLKCSS